MTIAFDLISDLNLTANTEIDWTGKPTSLFCLVSGNISSDLAVLQRTLKHLSGLYHGVFFIDGMLENKDAISRDTKVKDIYNICSAFKNVIYLHNNVVVIDGVALVGINGWQKTTITTHNFLDDFHIKCYKFEDITYLDKTIEKLQLHNDVKKILVVSSCIPLRELYFKEVETQYDEVYPGQILYRDTEHKIIKWLYGSNERIVDTTINGINYVNNAKFDKEPYYAKRVEVTI